MRLALVDSAACEASLPASSAESSAPAAEPDEAHMRSLLLGHPLQAMKAIFPREAACLEGAAAMSRLTFTRPAAALGRSAVAGPAASSVAPAAAASAGSEAEALALAAAIRRQNELAAEPVAVMAAAAPDATATRRPPLYRFIPPCKSTAHRYTPAPGTPLGHEGPTSQHGGSVLQPSPAALGLPADTPIDRQNWFKHVFACASVVAEMCAAATGGSFLQAMIALGF